jgi:hypothetical protein
MFFSYRQRLLPFPEDALNFPLGVKFINYLKPKVDPSYYWILFIITILVVFIIAWAFYMLFETFSEKISKKLKYKASNRQKLKLTESIVSLKTENDNKRFKENVDSTNQLW